MATRIEYLQNRVLGTLSEKLDEFYLAGGTALSLYYFHHRQSLDLDFFAQKFSQKSVRNIIRQLSLALNKEIELISEESRKNRVKIMVYSLIIDRKRSLKLDFVEDYLKLIRPPKPINGIKVLSLEDIYLRKIYAITGTQQIETDLGAKVTHGGRQEARDFYDLYCLSQIFMRLSAFCFKFGNPLMREGIIRWFRTYSRMDIKTGLLELKLKKSIAYLEMERHFKREVEKIIEKEVSSI
ncbi:MAG: nucleotidyl transferase AbiEii/AbiGii toxin family protein [Candidatus Omnitrophota bacterium]